MSQEQEQISSLELLVRHQYSEVKRNVYYHSTKGEGELDLVGIRHDGTFDVYEVKSTGRESSVQKAHRQLLRAEFVFGRLLHSMFIYVAESRTLQEYTPSDDERRKYGLRRLQQ